MFFGRMKTSVLVVCPHKTSLANTTLTNMLDRMENIGLIVRKPDPKDRRNKLIALLQKKQNPCKMITREFHSK